MENQVFVNLAIFAVGILVLGALIVLEDRRKSRKKEANRLNVQKSRRR